MKLLIVDDETSIAELLAEVFVAEGYECICAFSGNKAQLKLESEEVDLIISDVKMNDGDGTSLLKNIREKGNKTPLIFITGHSEFSEGELKSLGAIQVFYKPLEFDQFIREIGQVCQNLNKA